MAADLGTQTIALTVIQAIDRVAVDWLGPMGLRKLRIVPGVDDDGEPALFIEAYYVAAEEPIDIRITSGAHRALHEALAELGETRVAYLRHHFDDGPTVS